MRFGPFLLAISSLFLAVRAASPNDVRAEKESPEDWARVCSTPQGWTPQGLAVRAGQLYLSAHRIGESSCLFRLDESEARFEFAFRLPHGATHASGIDFPPDHPNRLFVSDFDSNRVYLVDVEHSLREGQAVVLTAVDVPFSGTSACCVVNLPGKGPRLMVTGFRARGWNIFFRYDLTRNRFDLDDAYTYANAGFSQGAKAHGEYIVESGNRLTSSYIVRHRLSDSLSRQRIASPLWARGPSRWIEDIALRGDEIYTVDERFNVLYRCRIDQLFPRKLRPMQRARPPLRAALRSVDGLVIGAAPTHITGGLGQTKFPPINLPSGILTPQLTTIEKAANHSATICRVERARILSTASAIEPATIGASTVDACLRSLRQSPARLYWAAKHCSP